MTFAQTDAVDAAELISAGSSYGLAILVAVGAWRAYVYTQRQEKSERVYRDKRDALYRRNEAALTAHIITLTRLVPADVTAPPFPTLEDPAHTRSE